MDLKTKLKELSDVLNLWVVLFISLIFLEVAN